MPLGKMLHESALREASMRPYIALVVLSGCLGLLTAISGCRSDCCPGHGQAAGDSAPRALFLVSEDPHNYEAHKTIPAFADTLQKEYHFQTRVIQGQGEPNAFEFPGLEAIREADLVVIFFRRRALPTEQLELIRAHLEAGKPLIGIRTANHAFSVREDVPEGYEKWWEFVPEVLGCENRGYGREADGTDVTVVSEAADHPILKGIEPTGWHSEGSLYLVEPLLDTTATVLLTGSVADTTEPIAWTRMYGSSRVFYTSLGYPSNFEQGPYRRLLVNAFHWAVNRPVPSTDEGHGNR
jgi:type 1 glutamine amidotransferase